MSVNVKKSKEEHRISSLLMEENCFVKGNEVVEPSPPQNLDEIPTHWEYQYCGVIG
jgi:hypothetical protein